jgi:hypothetical protein
MKHSWLLTLCLVLAGNAYAYAAEPVWHWQEYGTGGYSGQINLRDDQGSSMNYQRYDAAGSPVLFGSKSVQSPMVVIAGSGTDLEIDIVVSGVAVTKKVCSGTKTLRVFATPVTVCDSGVANNIQGIHVGATSTVTTFTPRLWIYTTPAGWRPVNNHPCGNLEVKQICE